jgi:glyoxylase I family protein
LVKDEPDTISPRHFCLHVRNAIAAREYLAQQGIRIEETVKIAAAERFFIRDPDGNQIEILQWLRPYQPERDGKFRA